jgi:tetratricopeptide (TPR) repeat protein
MVSSRHLFALSVVVSTAGLFVVLQATGSAQPAVETKQPFVSALIRFLEALPGAYGDEGATLRASLDAIEEGLARWEASLRAYEIAMAPDAQSARAPEAAAARRLLGAIYLERGWIDRALTELDAARRADPERADAHRLIGLAHAGADRWVEAADAFHRAWTVEPGDPVHAYLFIHHAMSNGRAAPPAVSSRLEAVPGVLKTLVDFQQTREANQDDRSAAPFASLTLLEERPATDPMFPPVRYADGFAAMRQGRYDEMVRRLRDALSSDPIVTNAARVLPSMADGTAALRDGRIAAARDHLTQAVRSAPDSSEAHRTLATAYALDELDEQSLAEFETAIRLDPHDERARLGLADALFRIDALERCEQALVDAVRVMPASGEAHWRLGQVYLRLARQQEALTHFERAAALGPLAGSSRVFETLGRLYLSASRSDEAIDAFRKHVRANLNDAEAHRELGDAYRAQDRVDEALAELVTAALLDPRDAEAHAGIARVHFGAGRYREAVASARRAVRLDEKHKDARYTLATALVRLGEEAEGRQQLERFERLQAEAMEAQRRTYELNSLMLEADLMKAEGRRNGVVEVWAQIVEREPDVSLYWVRLGRALAFAGRPEEAITALERARSLGAALDATRELVNVYTLIGRKDEAAAARAAYQRLKEERIRAAAAR